MLHKVRFQTFGYFGVPTPAPLTWNMFLAEAFVRARLAAAQKPLRSGIQPEPAQRLQLVDDQWERDWKPRKKGESGPGVILSYSLVFPDALNGKDAWSSQDSETLSFVEQTYNSFGGGKKALTYVRGVSDTWGELSGPVIPAGAGHAIRLWLHRPTSEQKVPVWFKRWGVVPSGRAYALRVIDGQMSVVRLSPSWTLDKEKLLWAQLEVQQNDASSTEEKEEAKAQAETLSRAIYTMERGVQTTGGSLYGRPLEIAVVPEGDAFSVLVDGKRSKVNVSRETINGADDDSPTLWDESTTILTVNGGAFFWQTGYPEFSLTGELRLGSLLGTFASADEFDPGDLDVKVTGFLPEGTGMTVDVRNVIDSQGNTMEAVELVAILTTENNRVSPVASQFALNVRGGPRQAEGGTTQSFDTKKLREVKGYSDPILDVVPQHDGEGRRRQYQVYMKDPKGRSLDPNVWPDTYTTFELLENRLCQLDLDGDTILKNGLVVAATYADAAGWHPNVVRQLLARDETVIQFTLVDMMQIAEERRCRDEVGDFRFRGEYLRFLLSNLGFSADEMQGVPFNAGGKLPGAKPGEDFKIRARKGQTYAEWFASFLKLYCPGWRLYWGPDGYWVFAKASKTIVANFSSSATRNNRKTYPGRYAMLQKLTLIRDTKGWFNVFTLTGGRDAMGEVISRVWRIENSIRRMLGFKPKVFVGRVLEADPMEEASIESEAEANKILRFTAEDQGLPRYGEFDTYFHTFGAGGSNLFPGDWVTCDDQVVRINRIPSGSLAEDKMTLGVQEMA